MIAKLIVGIMFLCFVGVIVGMVYIGKWSEEAMDQIMKEEENKQFDNWVIRQFDNFKITLRVLRASVVK